jgi:hypothetical protein
MRAYRGHEMREEPCGECGTRPAALMLLQVNPVQWVWLCPIDRKRKYPNRDSLGRPKRRVRADRQSHLARETASLGL